MLPHTSPLINPRAWTTGLTVAGILLVGAGMVLIATPAGDTPGSLGPGLASVGGVLLAIGLLRSAQGDKERLQDERTRKIGAYGLSWYWFLTFVVLFAVFWADYLHVWSPDAGVLSVLLIILMGISAKAFQWWFFRKGDVA